MYDSPLEGTGFEPSVPREASAFSSPVRADFSGGGRVRKLSMDAEAMSRYTVRTVTSKSAASAAAVTG